MYMYIYINTHSTRSDVRIPVHLLTQLTEHLQALLLLISKHNHLLKQTGTRTTTDIIANGTVTAIISTVQPAVLYVKALPPASHLLRHLARRQFQILGINAAAIKLPLRLTHRLLFLRRVCAVPRLENARHNSPSGSITARCEWAWRGRAGISPAGRNVRDFPSTVRTRGL